MGRMPRLRQADLSYTLEVLDKGSALRLAAKLAPGKWEYWNTLGAALVAAGDPSGAIEALRKSLEIGRHDATYDEVFLAMAYAALGRDEEARACLDRVDGSLEGRETTPELRRLRDEAKAVVER